MSFKVGDGVSICSVSDRSAATVSFVSPSGKTVRVKYDEATVVSGSEHDGSAKYEYAQRDGIEMTFTLRDNGRFVGKGESMKYGRSLVHGRHQYRDPHF